MHANPASPAKLQEVEPRVARAVVQEHMRMLLQAAKAAQQENIKMGVGLMGRTRWKQIASHALLANSQAGQRQAAATVPMARTQMTRRMPRVLRLVLSVPKENIRYRETPSAPPVTLASTRAVMGAQHALPVRLASTMTGMDSMSGTRARIALLATNRTALLASSVQQERLQQRSLQAARIVKLGSMQLLDSQHATSVSQEGGQPLVKETLATTAQLANGHGSVRLIPTAKTHHQATMCQVHGVPPNSTHRTVEITTARLMAPSWDHSIVIPMGLTDFCSSQNSAHAMMALGPLVRTAPLMEHTSALVVTMVTRWRVRVVFIQQSTLGAQWRFDGGRIRTPGVRERLVMV